MTTTIAKLRVGQRFSWIPAEWFGPCTLLKKTRHKGHRGIKGIVDPMPVTYDLKFDAKVVNPPGVEYGVPGITRVRLLKKR